MHPIKRFEEMIAEGTIKDMEPIPTVFDLYELKYLYNAGYIFELDGKFVACAPS